MRSQSPAERGRRLVAAAAPPPLPLPPPAPRASYTLNLREEDPALSTRTLLRAAAAMAARDDGRGAAGSREARRCARDAYTAAPPPSADELPVPPPGAVDRLLVPLPGRARALDAARVPARGPLACLRKRETLGFCCLGQQSRGWQEGERNRVLTLPAGELGQAYKASNTGGLDEGHKQAQQRLVYLAGSEAR